MSSQDEVLADRVRVGFRIPYRPALIEPLRSLFKQNKGYWAPDLKAWVVPAETAYGVARGLGQLAPDLFLADELCRQIDSARRDPDRAIARHIGLTLHPVRGGWTTIEFNYDPATVAAMHAISARYEPALRRWHSRIPPEELRPLLAEEAGIDPDDICIDRRIDEGEAAESIAHASIDVGATAPPGPLPGSEEENRRYLLALAQPLARHKVDLVAVQEIAERVGLYEHQVEAVIHLLSYSGCLLADDMGVGKTLPAIVAAMVIGARTVVVCPASLKLNWRRELVRCGVGAGDIFIINGSGDDPPAVPWIIVNYENLEVLRRRPELVTGCTQITDEAHFIKEVGALRTQRAFELAAHAARRFLLTATPMLNGPAEMYTLLRLSGHPAAAISFSHFAALYGQSRELLGQRIGEWLLRRTKDQVLTLPEKVRSMPYIEPPAELREEYDEIYQDNSCIPIQKLTRLRQALERMKLPFVIETAESVDEHSKVLIFCQYKATIANLAAHFGVRAVRFTGDESPHQRDEAVARFNNPDSGVRYFVATMEAGGVGLNLTAANYVIIASRHFTPSIQQQAEDRAFRIGQRRRVEVIVPTVADTVDEDIQALLDRKQHQIEQVLTARLAGGAAAQGEVHAD
ncbi:MAG: DEAD/DEAH box helicase [Deltaproteobacteria bacterium]|nr:DEAD/DEAH box helicase [Deltaproteobacteria bacterium]